MARFIPILALVAVVVLAGCLGSLGLGGSSDNPTTTTSSTETMQTATSTATAMSTEPTTTATTQTTTASSTTTTAESPTERTTTTYLRTRTTARVDTPEGSDRFEARVIAIVDPTTVTIEHDGKNQTVDLIGVRVPDSGLIHKRALQTTKAQLDHSVVTVVTDPKVAKDSDGHLQAYVYTGNWLYNTQLLRTGYARVTKAEFTKRSQFLKKQQQARQKGYGLWRNVTA